MLCLVCHGAGHAFSARVGSDGHSRLRVTTALQPSLDSFTTAFLNDLNDRAENTIEHEEKDGLPFNKIYPPALGPPPPPFGRYPAAAAMLQSN